MDQVARLSGLLARRERECARDVTVLTYHRVLEDERCVTYPFPSLAMPLSAFREQVRWLTEHGEVMSVAAALDSATEPSRPVFALSFDDGYRDSFENIAAVLDEFRLPGTFFVTTGFVESHELLWFDRAVLLYTGVDESVRREIALDICGPSIEPRLPAHGSSAARWTSFLKHCSRDQRRAILTWLEWSAGGTPSIDGFEPMTRDEVLDLHRRGHEIGSHSVSHPILTELDDEELHREIAGAQETLRKWLGVPVSGFCYPNGDQDERVVRETSETGHTYACTTRDGVQHRDADRFRVARVDIVRDRVTKDSRRFDAIGFRRELCGLYRHRSRTA